MAGKATSQSIITSGELSRQETGDTCSGIRKNALSLSLSLSLSLLHLTFCTSTGLKTDVFAPLARDYQVPDDS